MELIKRKTKPPMTSKQIEEGNKLMAEYVDFHNTVEPESEQHEEWIKYGYRYHERWGWQIPVYSKLMKELKGEMNWRGLSLSTEYNYSILNNDPMAGFTAIVSALNWYNSQKAG